MSELCVTTVFLSVLECNGFQDGYWVDRILCGLKRDTGTVFFWMKTKLYAVEHHSQFQPVYLN